MIQKLKQLLADKREAEAKLNKLTQELWGKATDVTLGIELTSNIEAYQKQIEKIIDEL